MREREGEQHPTTGPLGVGHSRVLPRHTGMFLCTLVYTRVLPEYTLVLPRHTGRRQAVGLLNAKPTPIPRAADRAAALLRGAADLPDAGTGIKIS